MNVQELWRGQFGTDYTARNARTTTPSLQMVWTELLIRTLPRTVLEVGANVGANLEAIAAVGLDSANFYACEPNDTARSELRQRGVVPLDHITADFADKLSFPDGIADLVFTSGVLIHVPPDKLLQSLREIHRCSAKCIILGEYFAPSEEMIPYRGHDNALWRRDYGGIFMDHFKDVYCLGTCFAWKRVTGIDNLTYWIFQKGPMRN